VDTLVLPAGAAAYSGRSPLQASGRRDSGTTNVILGIR
jgi:hypothetical protein